MCKLLTTAERLEAVNKDNNFTGAEIRRLLKRDFNYIRRHLKSRSFSERDAKIILYLYDCNEAINKAKECIKACFDE